MDALTQVDAAAFEPSLGGREGGDAASVVMKPDWIEGMSLEPHHFQAQDRYHEDLVRQALHMTFDRPWGVYDLAIDEHALAINQIVIRRLRAILPDGTTIVAGASTGHAIPPRYFDRLLNNRASLDVFVGLPLEQVGLPMVVVPGADPSARYAQEVTEIADYNTGSGLVSMTWARPNVRVLFEDEPLDPYSLLRVARIRAVAGGVELDPEFVPEVLRIRASPALDGYLRSVLNALLATLSSLGDVKANAPDATGTDVARLLLTSTLGRALPNLHAVLASETAHPREAYRVVAELVGALASFAPSGRARVTDYDPLDLRRTFDGLARTTREVLDALSGPSQRRIALERHDEHYWRAQLREPAIFGRDFLLVLTGGDAATLHARIPKAAKLAAWEEIGDFLQRHVAGVALTPEIRRPRGITLPADAGCFRIDKRSPAWASVVKHGSLGLWLPGGMTHLTPSLFAQEPNLLFT